MDLNKLNSKLEREYQWFLNVPKFIVDLLNAKFPSFYNERHEIKQIGIQEKLNEYQSLADSYLESFHELIDIENLSRQYKQVKKTLAIQNIIINSLEEKEAEFYSAVSKSIVKFRENDISIPSFHLYEPDEGLIEGRELEVEESYKVLYNAFQNSLKFKVRPQVESLLKSLDEVYEKQNQPVFNSSGLDRDDFEAVLMYLTKYRFISKETTIKEFIGIFTPGKFIRPVKWIESKSALRLLVKTIEQNGKFFYVPRNKWQVTVGCFVLYNNKTKTYHKISADSLSRARNKIIDEKDHQLKVCIARFSNKVK